jgi:hypothetical protein
MPVWFWQMLWLPVMDAGAGMVVAILTLMHEVAEVIPQVFTDATQILPPEVPDVTVILVEPCPDVMVHPVGTVHV